MATVSANHYGAYTHQHGPQQIASQQNPAAPVQSQPLAPRTQAPPTQPPQQKQAGNYRHAPVVVNDIIEDQTTYRLSGILKRYKTGNVLGRGGFAKCFHLTSLDTGREYAGKVIPKANLTSESAKAKIHAEIRIHRSVQHKHVVRFERYFDDGQNIVMLLELCRQQTLMELSKARGTLTETEVQYFLWQIVDVVHALHSHRIIHRDLKLGNLFLDENMNIKLGDFGLAARLDSLDQRKRTICGTPNYIAPEIISDKTGQGHSFEVDTWAIGVIAYTLLFGKPPFETQCIKATYQKIRENSYTFPDHTYVSPAAKDFIASTLRSSPSDRATLAQLRSHPFFTQSPFPTTMPPSIRHTPYPFVHHHQCAVMGKPLSPPNFIPQAMCPLPVIDAADAKTAATAPAAAPAVAAKPAAPVAPAAANPYSDENMITPTAAQPAIAKSAPVLNKPTRPLAPLSTATANVNTQPVAVAPYEAPKPVAQPIAQPVAPVAEDLTDLAARLQNVRLDAAIDEPVQTATRKSVEADFPVETKAPAGIPAPSPSPAPVEQEEVEDVQDERGLMRLCSDLWVNLWVDYSNKYGLGYILSNGSCGVHFNDYSKMVLHANGKDVQYIAKNWDAAPGEPSTILEYFVLAQPPAHLNKKATLLHHFLRYLLSHNHAHAPEPGSPDYLTFTDEFDYEHREEHALPHVRSWVRTEHAIVFRLSTRITQLIFFDETELMLNTETRVVTYTDKAKQRTAYYLDEVFDVPRPDLHKRMKYAKQIMQQGYQRPAENQQ